MKTNQRRSFGAEFKARVALEAARGVKTVIQFAAEHELNPEPVSPWKKELLQGAATVFQRGGGPAKRETQVAERERAQLERKVGHLTLERGWLSRMVSGAGMVNERRAMIDNESSVSVRRQCQLLQVNRNRLATPKPSLGEEHRIHPDLLAVPPESAGGHWKVSGPAHPRGGAGFTLFGIPKGVRPHPALPMVPREAAPPRTFPIMKAHAILCATALFATGAFPASAEITATVEKITSGPKHHFFGYIGHGLTIPWNASGRYIVSLRTDFIDRMPAVGDTADVVLIDTTRGYQVVAVDRTRAWNLQQGTMFYWNPTAAETQFFFNDIDPGTGQVFTVLYDIAARKRVREYRFGTESVANGGVAPNGKWFAGINYGKISRSREVIAYPGTSDAMESGPANPENDGVFRVDIATGERTLLVSYQHLQRALIDNPDDRAKLGDPEKYPLYAHHTLWNRDGEWLSFVVRGKGNKRPSAGCAVRWDGSDFRKIPFAGHPEWLEGARFVLASKEDGAYNLYDVAKAAWTGTLGGPGIFPDTDDDNALSPDGNWYVGSHRPAPAELVYTFFRRSDGAWGRSQPVPAKSGGGVVRIDSAPRWNRSSDTILAPGWDPDGTLQLYLVRLKVDEKQPPSRE